MTELLTENVTMMNGSIKAVKEITYGEWKATRNELGTEFDNDVAMIVACTDIDATQIDELDVPDYNSLRRASIKLNNPQSELQKAIKKGDMIITLSSPLMTVFGNNSNVINITMPKVKHSRELERIDKNNHNARMEYMIKAATGIADLDSMRMSDYSLLVVHVPDFFEKTVAFFRATK